MGSVFGREQVVDVEGAEGFLFLRAVRVEQVVDALGDPQHVLPRFPDVAGSGLGRGHRLQHPPEERDIELVLGPRESSLV
jgi:hypothetical protein